MELACTVDGIHYPINEPRPFKKKYKSHKHGSAGLDYEYCLYAHKPKLAWLNGPFPAGTHDQTVLRKELRQKIQEKQQARKNGFRVIADDGYFSLDLTGFLSFRNELDSQEVKYYKDRALSRHERFNGLTRRFDILNQKFRHDHGWNDNEEHPRHKAVVEAICVTVQYELDMGYVSLFDPYP